MNSWVMKRKKRPFWYLFFLVTLLGVRESLPLKQRRALIIKEDSLIVCRLKQRMSEGSEVKVERKFLSTSVLKICSLPLQGSTNLQKDSCEKTTLPHSNRLSDSLPVNAENKYFKIESVTIWNRKPCNCASLLDVVAAIFCLVSVHFCCSAETLFPLRNPSLTFCLLTNSQNKEQTVLL